jgi:hypothetical protein
VTAPLPEDARDRYEWLADRHFDGLLDRAESAELGRIVAAEPARATDLARRAVFHHQLRSVLRLEREYLAPPGDGPDPHRPTDGAGGPGSWATRAAGILVMLAIGGAAAGWFLASRPGGIAPPFAELTAAVGCVWSDPNVEIALRHGSLPSGPLELLSGRIEMRFASGGTAIIEGPATFEPIAADALRMLEGSARCRCPEPGTELRVETPSGTIVDLGTEFAVNVERGHRTRVAVLEGTVRLDTANTENPVSKLMEAGEAMSVDLSGAATADEGFLRTAAEAPGFGSFEARGLAGGENLLADGSFEGDAAGHEGRFEAGPWIGSASYVTQVSSPTADGTRAVRIAARGNRYWPLVGQMVATGPIDGRTVWASVKALQTASDPLSGTQRVILKLIFADAAGRDLGQAERHFLRAGSAVNEFTEGRIAAEAPAGTMAVKWQVLLNASGLPTGSIVVDDAALAIAGD